MILSRALGPKMLPSAVVFLSCSKHLCSPECEGNKNVPSALRGVISLLASAAGHAEDMFEVAPVLLPQSVREPGPWRAGMAPIG